jgi:hypothetical protein
MRRLLLSALLTGVVLITWVPTSASSSFTFNWTGGVPPSAPVVFTGSSNWDVSVHKRGTGEAMDPTLVQHGSDCSAPPATHLATSLGDGAYICSNHLMTGLSDKGYGQITITPNQLVDFSQGTATIKFAVSTLHFNARDWLEFWLTPWDQNVLHPFNDAVDLQGPPRNAVRLTADHSSGNNTSFVGSEFVNFQGGSSEFAHSGVTLESVFPPSAVVRTQFELDISTTHVRLGIPGVGLWWVDSDLPHPLSFNQAIFQINTDSYDPCKDQAISLTSPCDPDTWHWSDVSISSADPFTMLKGSSSAVSAGTSPLVQFSSPAPAGSFLRFEGIGNLNPSSYQVSFNNGATWQAAVAQQQNGDNGTIHPEHFGSYWMPVPAGVTSAEFRGQSGWWGAWEVRDPAIWSLSGSRLPPTPSPVSTVTPTPTPTPTIPLMTPSPTPALIPITSAPCSVLLSGTWRSGHCSGTFQSG